MALAPRITIEGTGRFAGVSSDIAAYSSQEDATPVLLGSTSGGMGQLSYAIVSSDEIPGDPMFAWLGTAHASPSVARFASGREVYNAVPNPVLGTNTTGWSTTATSTSARVATGGPGNNGYFRAVLGTSNPVDVTVSGSSVVPGQPATGSMYFRTSVARPITLTLSFLDNAGAVIRSAVSPSKALAADQWVRVAVDGGTVPTGAVTARLTATITGTASTVVGATLAQITPSAGHSMDVAGNMPPVNARIATRDLLRATVRLDDGSNGVTRLVVNSLDDSNGTTAVSADSRLAALQATRTGVPMQGTPEQIIRYYLGLGGITTGIVYQGTGSTSSRAVQGWTGVVWDYLRAFLTAVNAEIALVSGNVVIRPLRMRTSVNRRNSDVSVNRGIGEMAQTVVVNYYNNTYKTGLVYPMGGWNEDVQVYQVDPGETWLAR